LSNEPSGAAAMVLAQAARALRAVAFSGRTSDEALAAASGASRAAVRAVTLGSLRWYPRLEPIVAYLLVGKALAPLLRTLLIAALHQLEYSRNPPEVTVSSAVDAARLLQQPRAAGLINALLRRYGRERVGLLEVVLQDDSAACAHPAWLLAALRASWPEQWRQIVEANNEHPPMTLRVDLTRVTREAYCTLLQERALGAVLVPWLPTALVLDTPVPVGDLPGFADGLVSVQDAGAQLASALLAPLRGERVLDACAAPGGKTGALLEALDGAIELTAVDCDAARVELIDQNLRRLRRTARLVHADLRSDLSWWDGNKFDRILLDAPCSATGVIRRHPDIKLLRRSGDIAALEPTQREILTQCLGLLKPGGILVYSTCSLLGAENEQLVATVLAQQPAARMALFPAATPLPSHIQARQFGVQLLPGAQAQSDGFYYACLTVT
jgi:16S rRNA (cytosine967-C5)-methyltransferase